MYELLLICRIRNDEQTVFELRRASITPIGRYTRRDPAGLRVNMPFYGPMR